MIAFGQVAIGSINYLFVAACLHQAISAVAEIPYFSVVSVYIIANATALISHSPGGLGVLESVVLYFLSDHGVIGALIVFRLTYYLIPLLVGSLLFLATELVLHLKR
jgi:uncharacterized membrane protein YbhN (UPF0104 family)